MKTAYLSLFLGLFLLLGCTINQKKRFDQVQVGMDKDQVLGLLASPQRTQRWQGMDRWTYIFFEDEIKFEKEIHFLEGTAAYVGDIPKPALSADERDKKQDEENAEYDRNYQTKRDENRKSYEDYGSDGSNSTTPRYVPEFKPIQ